MTYFEDTRCKLFNGDSAKVLAELPADSVQLVVTSPPYDNLRTYGGHSWSFEAIATELARVVCDGGLICWNVGDALINGSETLTSFKQAIYFKEHCGLLVHDTMIWHKRNFSSPSSTRYHQTFEYVFVFSKNTPRCFNPIKDRRNATAGMIGNLGVNTFANADGSRSERAKHMTQEFGMRHNVWDGPTRGQEDMCCELPHPAMMPKWLARDLILSWSNHGDTVLDPFCGSGTTIHAALNNGRKAIGIDAEEKYCAVALADLPEQEVLSL